MTAACVTILHAPGKVLTKTYRQGKAGKVSKRDYDKTVLFHSSTRELATFADLVNLLRELERRPDHCVIRAAPGKWHPGAGRPALRRIYAALELVDDRGRFQKPARTGTGALWQEREVAGGRLRPVTVLPHFEEQPTSWLLLDFDGVAAPAGVDWRADLEWTANYLRHQLPSEFRAARCVYYATASAADLTKPELGGNQIRMRLGFLLARGVVAAQAKQWLAGVDGLDPSTLRAAQPVYTSRPIFRDGLADPLPVRLGVLDGQLDRVPVPAIEVDQRFQREAFAGLGPARSAEGLGLVEPHPRLDAALTRLQAQAGAGGTVRKGLLTAAFAYVRDAGRDHVDIEALAAFLAEIGEQYRTAAEVAAYNLENLIAWVLERAPEEPAQRPHYSEQGLPADEATTKLRREVEAAIAVIVAWHVAKDGTPAPVFGFKAGAGLGKTGCALEFVGNIPGIENMNVEMYAPSHRLAEELAARTRTAVPPGVRVIVILGRGATGADGKKICRKWKLAGKLAEEELGARGRLCKSKDEICEFHAGCRHPAQFSDKRPAIRIFAHAYMFTPRNEELPKPDLIVVDESFWEAGLDHRELALDRLAEVARWQPRRHGGAGKNATLEQQAFAKAKWRKERADRIQDATVFANLVRSAFEDGRDPRTVGVTAADCERVAALERDSRGRPRITPGMEYSAQRAAWASWRRDECSKAARFWGLLAAEHRHPGRPIQRITLERDAKVKGGDRRHLLHLHFRRELTLPPAPVILLDADLEPTIAGKFFPQVQMVEIPVRQQVEVIQVFDRTVSMKFLLGAEGGNEAEQRRAARRRDELERGSRRFLAGSGLLVAYKALVPQLTLPAGVDAAHHGNLLGLDCYKHHDRAVIAGRLEPKVLELEDTTRAMFGDEPEPLQAIEPDGQGFRRYWTQKRRYRMAGGRAGRAVAVSVHPDRRAQLLLEQGRERGLGQAVARLRLVHDRGPSRPATVLLATNLPCDLEVTELTTWGAAMRDREADACALWGGAWLCSASERRRCAPYFWSTAQAAENSWRRWKKGVPNPSTKESVERFGTPFPGDGPVTLVEYRRPGQRGSAHQVLLPGEVLDEAAARAQVEAITGPVAAVTVVRIVHRGPIEEPGESAPPDIPFPDDGLRILTPLPDESYAISGNVAVQRTVSLDGRTAITSMVKRVRRAAERGPQARAGP